MIRPKIIRPKVIKPNKFQKIIRPNVSKSYKTECYPKDYKTESKDYKTELGKNRVLGQNWQKVRRPNLLISFLQGKVYNMFIGWACGAHLSHVMSCLYYDKFPWSTLYASLS